jgi:hypothetical protein
MSREILDVLLRQHEIAWSLTSYHLETLSTEECLWRPSSRGLHVSITSEGAWRGEWPDHEGYDLGPPSIAWLLWHMGFWWSMAIDHCFEGASLDRHAVTCPGGVAAAKSWLQECHEKWQALLSPLSDDDLRCAERTRWPYRDRPFSDVVGWVNIELTKNAAELGYARFLYATRPSG